MKIAPEFGAIGEKMLYKKGKVKEAMIRDQIYL